MSATCNIISKSICMAMPKTSVALLLEAIKTEVFPNCYNL